MTYAFFTHRQDARGTVKTPRGYTTACQHPRRGRPCRPNHRPRRRREGRLALHVFCPGSEPALARGGYRSTRRCAETHRARRQQEWPVGQGRMRRLVGGCRAVHPRELHWAVREPRVQYDCSRASCVSVGIVQQAEVTNAQYCTN